MKQIDVSFVMTVYNKEKYLPSVLKALLNQTGLKNPEFIFCDDVSTDKSVEIIRQMTKGIPNVIIQTNTENKGPSVRNNQGILLARGKWIRFMDSDDIFPLDSTQKMLELAEKHNADIVYGTFVKTGKEPEELTNEKMPQNPPYIASNKPLDTILWGRFTRMGQLIKRDVVLKAKGLDEESFIQDESLPIRCAPFSKGVIKIFAPVILVPIEIGNFSKNKPQLLQDAFIAYANWLRDNTHLDKKYQKRMYQKAISCYYKHYKKTLKKMSIFHPVFWLYIKSKVFKPMPNFKFLEKMRSEILSFPPRRQSFKTTVWK